MKALRCRGAALAMLTVSAAALFGCEGCDRGGGSSGSSGAASAPSGGGPAGSASAAAPASAAAQASATPSGTLPASAAASPARDAVSGASARYDGQNDAGVQPADAGALPSGTAAAATGGDGPVDGAALRRRHIERLKADTSEVTLLKGETAFELGKRICEAAAPRRPKETPVLLKPNLCGFDSIKDPQKSGGDDGVHGRSTDVGFTRGVVQCLKARGHTAITIAEGCGISHKHWQDVIALTGYETMAREEGVTLVAMDDDGVFDLEGDKPGKPLAVTGIAGTHAPTLLLPKVLAEHLDHGLFLSLPKIKAHRYAVVSIGIKGMQGTVMLSDKLPAYKQKWRMHKELGEYLDQRKAKLPEDRKLYVDTLMAFTERMVDTLELATPDAVLAEGAPAMGGDGFQSLRPSAEKVAVGGSNPVLVDEVSAKILGLYDSDDLARELLGHRTSPLIEVAARRYKLDLKATRVVGDGASLLEAKRPAHFKAMAPFAIDRDPPGVTTPAAPVWADLIGPVTPAAPAVPSPPTTAPPATAPPTSAPATPSPPSPSGKPEVHAAARGEGAVTLDGLPNEAAWRLASPARWETDYAGAATGTVTAARFLWDAGGLYALFELSGAGLHTDRARPTDVERVGLYKEDCVEIFLTPDPARPKRYLEVEVGPFGHFFDLAIDRDAAKKEDTAWSSGLSVGVRQDAASRRATIEVRLSAPEVTRALTAGARLPLGLYRMEGTGERQYLAWSPPRTAKPNFHVPEAFGTLILDAPKP